MEIKEAIGMLEMLKPRNPKSSIDNLVVNAYEIAISALERQIEKKPNVQTEDIDRLVQRYWAYRKNFDCPNCGSRLKIETWTTDRIIGKGTILKDNSKISYCPYCGQKIDWTE